MACLICERIQWIKDGKNPYFVIELNTGFVVLGDYQRFKGYTLFLCKEHKSELHYLAQDFKIRFLEEMSLVAEAVANVYHPNKMNYELLGNGDAHLHWHLFPRYEGDLEGYSKTGRGPVWWIPLEEMFDERYRLSSEQLESETKILKDEICALIQKYNK